MERRGPSTAAGAPYDETRAPLAAIVDKAEAQIEAFTGAWQKLADELEAGAAAAVEKLNVALPDPHEPVELAIMATAPEPLYSSRDDWREATEKLIAYRDLGDLGGDLDEEPTE